MLWCSDDLGGRRPRFSNEVAESLDRAATRYEIDDEDDQRDDEQQVNQATANVTNESQQPQYEQNYKNGPQHSLSPFIKPQVSSLLEHPVGCNGHAIWTNDMSSPFPPQNILVASIPDPGPPCG